VNARVVVTGGAGFLGSHICDALLMRGDEVIAVDNLSTGRSENLAHLASNERFHFVEADVIAGIPVTRPIDAVLHFASPASPPRYLALGIETLRAGALGTENALGLATSTGARFLLASTSEVYGDPQVHPQRESYWGYVNPIGLRSVYDEAKRYAESITMAYRRTFRVDVAIARLFNTYGPRMDPYDGRVVTNLVRQALAGEALTVYGDGSQTRSFCYVDDVVTGVLALLDSGVTGPVNLGNPHEVTVLDLARLVLAVTGSTSQIVFAPLPTDDPCRRCPDIDLAQSELGWAPTVGLEEGVRRTAAAMRLAGLPA
jgi:dTDP-glucose 4,6-dehydratase